jgi:hypothetical protein
MSRFFKKPHIGKKRFKYQFDLIIDSVQVSVPAIARIGCLICCRRLTA